ncbi:hypothetical protein JOD25_003147 [Kurthia huakuii]|nr:hypothetical protein [Kurthia huakuii]
MSQQTACCHLFKKTKNATFRGEAVHGYNTKKPKNI